MKITHKLPGLIISKDNCNTNICIQSNKKGNFIFLSEPVISKFNGFFLNMDLELYKIIENISIVDSEFNEIENNLSHIKRKHKDTAEKIICPEDINGIVYTLSKRSNISIDFDCRHMNDMRNFGRIYNITIENKNIIIQFVKKTDDREDNKHNVEEYTLYIVIRPKSFKEKDDYEFTNQWIEQHYSYDHERNDFPINRYIYRPFRVNSKKLLIGIGKTKKNALDEIEKLKRFKIRKNNYASINKKKNPTTAAAFICAQESIEKMKSEYGGITRLYAGFPWFFQFWSRDETICLGSLIRLRQFKIVKDILFTYMKHISKDGRLPNRIPSSQLGSADGVGWFWKRITNLIDPLEKLHLSQKYLSSKDMKNLREALAESINHIEKNYKSDGLITNNDNETWMDTDPHGHDPRDGKRIEIQALHLNMLRLMHKISGEKKYKTREEKMKKEVIKKFWNGKCIADGIGDNTIRPNIFIAYYVYPDLLPRKEWQTCFENVLDRLWLNWGGISSIDKTHPMFVQDYTGLDDKSYHRGDSWYWINNLAALCMFRNNPIEFDGKIKKIIKASSNELLWNGSIGDHAEISSASHLSSKGCFAQAWSAAMFIELIIETMGG